MPILGTIVHQQQNASVYNRIDDTIEKRLGLAVDPVQVLENYYQWLVQTLAQQYALKRFLRPPPDLRVHLGEWIVALLHSHQREDVGQGIFEGALKHQHLAGDFLAPGTVVIFSRDMKILAQ
jgi:hypothetical protein